MRRYDRDGDAKLSYPEFEELCVPMYAISLKSKSKARILLDGNVSKKKS